MLETREVILDAQEHMQQLLDIQMMEAKLGLDYHQDLERLFQETVEQQ